MKTFRSITLLLALALAFGFAPSACFAVEYCWDLSYPGMTTAPEYIRVGVLDIGNGHLILAGSAKIPSVLNPKVINSHVVHGSAEEINKVLEVSLTLSNHSTGTNVPGGSNDVLGTRLIHMRLNPVNLNGDYARIIEGGNASYQMKGIFFDGIVKHAPCR